MNALCRATFLAGWLLCLAIVGLSQLAEAQENAQLHQQMDELVGQRLVSADRQPKNPRLKLWDFASGKEQRSIDVPQLSAYRRVEDIEWGGIRAITLSADGNTLVACGSNEYSGPACALLFDLATGELKRKLSSTLKGFHYSA
jgi:WD40 repeat protein